MTRTIEEKFKKDFVPVLIKRFGGFSFFSDITEDYAIKQFTIKRNYSGKEILGIMLVSVVTNFDTIEIKNLCDAFECSLGEIEDSINADFVKKKLPIKMDSEYAYKKIDQLKRLMKNTDEREKSRIREALERHGYWMKKGWISIIN